MDEEIIENLNDELDEALERGRRLVKEDELAERLDELRQRAEILIRKHPVKSLAGGLILGFIFGKLTSSDE